MKVKKNNKKQTKKKQQGYVDLRRYTS